MNTTANYLFGRPMRLVPLALGAISLALTAGSGTAVAAGPAPVDLLAASHFVILTKTGITNVPTSSITGDIGTSPITSAAITGFSLVADATNRFSTSTQVTGKVYAANDATPTPADLTAAVGDMGGAYNEAAGRALPDFTELYSGNLSGRTLVPGLYKWSSGVSFTTDVMLAGGGNDVWIFQIAGNLTAGSGARILLSGGARAGNVYWQVAGGTGVEIGTTAHLEGTILAAKAIHLRTGASLNGRALSQTAVTLEKNKVVIARGGPLCGDFSGDGKLSVGDALGVLRAAVGATACPLVVCDFNGDGVVTASDALAILRAAVGLPGNPSCPMTDPV